MSIERKLIPCEEDDPRRCNAQGMNGQGQCSFLAVEGQTKCPAHHGLQEAAKVEKKRLHDYRLQVWQQRLDEFTESENVKNLRGEVAILRLCIESILSMCKEPAQLMLYSGKIGDLVAKTEKLVVSCDRFETKVGMLLDKSKALILASQVVEVIAKEINDPEVIDRISNGIITVISGIGSLSDHPEEGNMDM